MLCYTTPDNIHFKSCRKMQLLFKYNIEKRGNRHGHKLMERRRHCNNDNNKLTLSIFKKFHLIDSWIISCPRKSIIFECTDKKNSSYKEIQKEAVAKSYMTNGLLIQYMTKNVRISSYIRKPFLIYDFATALF